MRNILSVAIVMLAISCGGDDIDSVSKFISKTQKDTTDDNAHRPGEGLENAFLINKVHRGERRRESEENLTVHVNVGYWYGTVSPGGGTTSCTTPTSKVWHVRGSTKNKPVPENSCNRKYCVANPAGVVNKAIQQWLAPLATYGSTDKPIVSGDFVTTNTKETPDLIINFICGHAAAASDWIRPNIGETNNSDCPDLATTRHVRSCTRYHKGTGVAPSRDREVVEIRSLDRSGSSDHKKIPIIYIGTGPRPYSGENKEQHDKDFTQYDRIEGDGSTADQGQHDLLDLLHELGHAFGLADTHDANKFGKPISKQPTSIMSGNRPPDSSDLELSSDDKKGIQWLYEHHHRGIDETNCFFDDYTHQGSGDEQSCIPASSLLQALIDKKPSQALRLLIDSRSTIKINAKTPVDGNSALHLAINEMGAPGITPTDANDYLDVIRAILRHPSADSNIQDSAGSTPLHKAVQWEKPLIVTLLLATANIRVQTKDDNGNTPLHLAASMGFTNLVAALEHAFTSYVGVTNNNGKTAFHLAAENGHLATVRAFNDYPDGIAALAGAKDKAGNNALHLAAISGQTEVIRTIISEGGRGLVNETNKRGETPLHLAATLSNGLETVTVLLTVSSIDITAETLDIAGKNTALHLAAINGNAATVALLLDQRGIDKTTPNGAGNTARDEAVIRQSTASLALRKRLEAVVAVFDGGGTRFGTSSAQRLLKALKNRKLYPDDCVAGSGQNSADELADCRRNVASAIIGAADDLNLNYQETGTKNAALHVAVAQAGLAAAGETDKYELIVDLLLRESLINPNIKNSGGDAPLHLAVRQEKETIVRLLAAHPDININLPAGRGLNTPLHLAVKSGDEAIVGELLRCCVGAIDINLHNRDGQTPLHLAVAKRSEEITQALLDNRSIKVNELTRDSSKETALHIAVESDGSEDIVETLLQNRDIDVNIADASGDTALHIATHRGRAEVVEQLLAVPNIDLEKRDGSGYTAFEIAQRRKREAVIDVFAETPHYRNLLRGTFMEVLRDESVTETEAIEILKTEKPDVNEKDRQSGNVPLHYAIDLGWRDLITELLLQRTLQVNIKNSDGDTALHAAFNKDDSATITALLKRRGIRPNERNSDGETVLLLAAAAGKMDIVSLLLGHNAINVNVKDRSGSAALHLAVSGKHREIVTALLANDNIDVNAKDGANNTALHLALNAKDEAIVTTLLEEDSIDVNIKNTRGDTPLHTAVRTGLPNLITPLLAHERIRVNDLNQNGDTPLLAAVRARQVEVVSLLIRNKSVDVNAKDSANNTALLLAVTSKASAIVTALLAHAKIDVNAKNTAGNAALHLAVENNDRPTVEAILRNARVEANLVETATGEQNTPLHIATLRHINTGQSYIRVILQLLGHNGIRPNIKNRLQDTPLMIAVKEENNTLVSNLLQYTNVDVNTADSRDKTALMYASERGSQGVVQRLLNRSANPNLQDGKKFTALHYACHYGRVEVVRLLLGARGIDLTIDDKWGLTARERAALRGHNDVVALFETRRVEQERRASAVSILAELARGDTEDSIMTIVEGGNIKVNALDTDNRNYTALHYAANLGYERVVRALLEYDDVRANAADTSGQTALHLATARNRLAVVQALLAHSGTNVAAKTNKGFTALHWSAQLGYTDIARALLAGDDNLVNQQTNRKRTALHYASWLGQRAIVNLLIQQDGINLNYVDDNRDTALHYAAAHNRLTIAEYLLESGARTGIGNKQYKTARALAHDKGYTQMVQLIDRYRN